MRPASDAIATYHLYGEVHQVAASDFIHVEDLDDRSAAHDWTIAPHTHAALNHIFLVSQGEGRLEVDGRTIAFRAPCLLLIPAGVVHAFCWRRLSQGRVLTLMDAHWRKLASVYADLVRLFDRAHCLIAGRKALGQLLRRCDDLRAVLGSDDPARQVLADALLLTVMAAALNGLAPSEAAAAGLPSRRARLVARFKDRIEARFRLREPVSDYAAALGVSEPVLRQACARVAKASPSALLDARTILQARRALAYSSQSVADIGYGLGFADPAHFSRFFSRHVGCSPRRFREQKPRV